MYRLIKATLAEFSFLLEYYTGINAAWVTLLVVGAAFGVVVGFLTSLLEKIIKKRVVVWPVVVGWICYDVDLLMKNMPTWNSRLHRTLDNFSYIMSFDSNNKLFFSGLGIAGNEANKNAVMNIAFYLNHDQWQNVIDNGNNMAWYFEKVRNSIESVVKLGSMHLGVGLSNQWIGAFLPVVAVVIIGVFMVIKKRRAEGIMIVLNGLFFALGNLGAGIFLLVMVLYVIGTRFYLEDFVQERKKESGD